MGDSTWKHRPLSGDLYIILPFFPLNLEIILWEILYILKTVGVKIYLKNKNKNERLSQHSMDQS